MPGVAQLVAEVAQCLLDADLTVVLDVPYGFAQADPQRPTDSEIRISAYILLRFGIGSDFLHIRRK